VDVLGEYTKTEEGVKQVTAAYISTIKAIHGNKLKSSLAVKLTALGANFDKTLCQEKLGEVLKEAAGHHVNVEVDMEGAQLVDYTLQILSSFSAKGFSITLALQAYLNRTPDDLMNVSDKGIKVRLVKGAYKGDLEDYKKIQERFKELFEALLNRNNPFFVGTHDPLLIEWIKEKTERKKEFLEFGFLKVLADKTKLELVNQGWLASEYIPFGDSRTAYEKRRKRYLEELGKLGRAPVP
jgi:proline dehydrogenase